MKLLGHRLHPPLTDFPVALWSASLLWDVVGYATGDPFWTRFSFWSIALGLAAALPTLATGLLDYLGVPEEQAEAARTALRHMIAMLCTTALFAGSLIVRATPNIASPSKPILAFLLSLFGIAILSIGAWLGGELVYRHGIGQETGER